MKKFAGGFRFRRKGAFDLAGPDELPKYEPAYKKIASDASGKIIADGVKIGTRSSPDCAVVRGHLSKGWKKHPALYVTVHPGKPPAERTVFVAYENNGRIHYHRLPDRIT
ncbi:MAG: hypothetical protein ABID38_00030 [Candidatus Diapherotrites archaeon]